MKVTSVRPMQGAYVGAECRDYVRYCKNYWAEIVDTPVGDIEQEIYDEDLMEQLEAAYQEYMK